MHSFTLPAPAKINLFLHITGQRRDGYHNLQTLFQLLDYGDEIAFQPRQDGQLSLRCTGHQIDGLIGDDNLVLRAARQLRDAAGDPTLGAELQLHKRLPAGGGLGGGSSDAATTLLGLNRLWRLNWPRPRLLPLAQGLGADVPVFVNGYSAWAEGIGERLQSLTLPERCYVVVHPGCHIDTAAVFSHPELTRDSRAITMSAFFAGDTRNDCQSLVRRLAEPVDKALNWLQKFGNAKLTGTGACVFIATGNRVEAERIAGQVPAPWSAFAASGVNVSPALEKLQRLGEVAH